MSRHDRPVLVAIDGASAQSVTFAGSTGILTLNDALAFTGGIGENADGLRGRIVERVRFLGAFRVEVVPAREELVIAQETERLLSGG